MGLYLVDQGHESRCVPAPPSTPTLADQKKVWEQAKDAWFDGNLALNPWTAPATTAPALRAVPSADAPVPTPAPTPTPLTDDGVDPERLCRTVIPAALEVMGGLRPPAQLTRWISRSLYPTFARISALRTRQGKVSTAWQGAAVRTVRWCQPAAGVIEAAVVVATVAQVLTVAVRMEKRRDTYQVTVFDLL